MDRKPKENCRKYGKFNNGASMSKEEALEKLHQMEWARNKQDTWHLSRPNVRYEVREKKKYGEDNYFDGTGNQKSRRFRKPRDMDGQAQHAVPTGFSSTYPAGPPPVSAWTQKKGSDLFSKPQDCVDEDDEMLKLALQESLKTAEFEKLRHLERQRLFGAYPEKDCVEETEQTSDVEEEEETEDTSPDSSESYKKESDLRFVDTDSSEDLSTSNKKKIFMPIKQSSSQENASFMAVNKKPQDFPKSSSIPNQTRPPFVHREPLPSPQEIKNDRPSFGKRPQIEHQPHRNQLNDNICVPSRQFVNISSANQLKDDLFSESTKPYNITTSLGESNGHILIPERDDKPIRDLSANMSSLTFGDTKDILDHLHFEYDCQLKSGDQSYKSVLSSKETTDCKNTSDAKESIRKLQRLISLSTTASNPDENDLIIHSFTRRNPPSDIFVHQKETEIPVEVLSLDTPQQHFTPNSSLEREGESLSIDIESRRQSQSMSFEKSQPNSNTSLSNSPLQNDSPYGSFGKQSMTNSEGFLQTQSQGVPFHQMNPINLNDQDISSRSQEQQLASHLGQQVPYPNHSPGFVTHPPHLGLPLSNTVSPFSPISNLNMPQALSHQGIFNPLNQPPQMQQYYHQQLLMQQHQHAQLAAFSKLQTGNSEPYNKPQSGVYGPTPSLLQNVNESPLLIEKHSPPIIQNLSEFQPQMIHLQNQQMQLKQQLTNPQMIPITDISTSQNKMAGQYEQSYLAEQGKKAEPSKEEIWLEYQKAQQMIINLRLQLAQAENRPLPSSAQPILLPNHHSAMGYFTPSLHNMPLNQQIPVQQVEINQLSPNQQSASVDSRLLNMIPETDA